LPAYRDRLDSLTTIFGEDRVIFGSDYPQSDSVAALPQVVGLAQAYASGKSSAAKDKFFFRNARRVYALPAR
ncbi:amidohydrolase family protein, partial [Novosphingobium rosa]|uniref:amidohydrolase family protein n=1 Tax=Novosphingobium rosa TaxID=76978 RepID=UPI000AD6C742